MTVITSREHAGRLRHASGLPFELVVSKLRRPSVRQGTVRRSLLIERLARGDLRPVVSVVAPAGYGKTTLLAQWAERNGQAFAWVSLDERDNDPKVLLSYVAAALDAVEPVGERVFDALASPGSSVPGPVVSARRAIAHEDQPALRPRLRADALASTTSRTTFVTIAIRPSCRNGTNALKPLIWGRCEAQSCPSCYCAAALSFVVIPGRARERTRNLEIPGSMRCIAPE